MSFAHFTALAQYSYFSSFSFGLVFATFSGGSQTTSLLRIGVSAVARVATNVPTCACLTLTSCADPRIASWLPLKTHNFSKNQLTFLSKKKIDKNTKIYVKSMQTKSYNKITPKPTHYRSIEYPCTFPPTPRLVLFPHVDRVVGEVVQQRALPGVLHREHCCLLRWDPLWKAISSSAATFAADPVGDKNHLN